MIIRGKQKIWLKRTLLIATAAAMVSSVAASRLSAGFVQITRRTGPCFTSRAALSIGPSVCRLYSVSIPSAAQASDQAFVAPPTISDTPLGNSEAGKALLDGLDVYTVPAKGDHHPLSVYGIDSAEPQQSNSTGTGPDTVRPILLLHGRTWSSVPVYHLLGGNNADEEHESRSLMEAFRDRGLQPYCMDFRGFGSTPMDESASVEPLRCVLDAETVLEWITRRHGMEAHEPCENGLQSGELPALLGWSQGAMVAQLAAQKRAPHFSKLILYGSLYDPLVRYPREPLYSTTRSNLTQVGIANDMDSAMEDFTIEGSIPPEPAHFFAKAALIADPVRAVWKHLYQFNNCDPARIHVPTLVVAGDQDPYAPLHIQQDLFTGLGRASDRTWSILSDADHAAHLLDGRRRFANIVTSFVLNGKRSENAHHFY